MQQRLLQYFQGKSGRIKLVRLLLFALLCFYVALNPAVVFAYFEFRPIKVKQYLPDEPRYNRSEVTMKGAEDSRLSAWYFQNPQARYTVLIHHGQAGNLSHYLESAHAFYDAGASVLLYDYSGYGKSNGQPSNKQLLQDAETAYQFLTGALNTPKEQIVQAAISMGHGPAYSLARNHPVRAMVLVSPYKSLESVWRLRLPYLNCYPSFCFPAPDLACNDLFQCKSFPVLMFHASDDPILPVEQADEIYRECRGRKTFYRGPMGGHLGCLTAGARQDPNSATALCARFLTSLN